MDLRTERLRLIQFEPAHLLTLIDAPERFAEHYGYPAAEGLREFFVSGDISPEWLATLRSSSGADPWKYGFGVIDEGGMVIGTAGFKGPPDEGGVVEIAYGIVHDRQGKGFASEAASALTEFALNDARIALVRAHTLAETNASTRVLAKCGFSFLGEVVDPEDGLVWRWERARRRS